MQTVALMIYQASASRLHCTSNTPIIEYTRGCDDDKKRNVQFFLDPSFASCDTDSGNIMTDVRHTGMILSQFQPAPNIPFGIQLVQNYQPGGRWWTMTDTFRISTAFSLSFVPLVNRVRRCCRFVSHRCIIGRRAKKLCGLLLDHGVAHHADQHAIQQQGPSDHCGHRACNDLGVCDIDTCCSMQWNRNEVTCSRMSSWSFYVNCGSGKTTF